MHQVYIYQADVYCEACGKAIQQRLKLKGKAPNNVDDERTFDSDEYPKGPYSPGESDSPQHCGMGRECPNHIELKGHKIGKFLENELTSDGVKYVKEAIKEGGEVAELWADFYQDYDLN